MSDEEAFKQMMDAKRETEYWLQTNIYGLTDEQLMEVSRKSRQASDRYFNGYQECRRRGLV